MHYYYNYNQYAGNNICDDDREHNNKLEKSDNQERLQSSLRRTRGYLDGTEKSQTPEIKVPTVMSAHLNRRRVDQIN